MERRGGCFAAAALIMKGRPREARRPPFLPGLLIPDS